MAPHED
jgi:predicted nuclease with TOPRIM domain